MNIRLALMSAGAALMALPAVAQESAAHATGIQEVVVTARKRAENVQDVPIAITAVSSKTLEAHGITQMQDLQKLAPSLMMLPSNGVGGAVKMSLRGQYQNDFVATIDNSVAVYVDGVLMARQAGLNLNFPDIDRIEVLRGPQGTLFGRNTTGGAITVTTADPVLNRTLGKVKAGYGNYNAKDLQAVLNVPIVEDVLALRASGYYNRHGGYDRVINDPSLTPVAGRRVNSLDALGGQVKLRYTPNSRVNWILKADYIRNNNKSPVARVVGFAPNFPAATATLLLPVASLTDDPNPFRTRFVPTERIRNYGLTSTLTVDVNEATQVKFISSYRHLKNDFGFDVDAGIPSLNNNSTWISDDVFTEELQLTGKLFDNAVEYATGLYYFQERGQQRHASSSATVTWLPSPAEPNNFVNSGVQNGTFGGKSKAVYGQATWHATDQLDLTGGIRYSHETKSLTARNYTVVTVGGVNGFNCASITSATRFFSPTYEGCGQRLPDLKKGAVNYNLTAQYKLRPSMMVYAKLATGFRSGGQNIAGSNQITYRPFGPEKVKEYEVGMKADFFDRRLRANIAAFYDDYTDIQRTVSVVVPGGNPPSQQFTINAAKGRVKGVEVELTAAPTDRLTIGGAVGYLDAAYLRFTSAGQNNPNVVVDRRDEHFPGAPRWTANVYADYVFPTSQGDLVLHADYAMHSRYQGTVGAPFADTFTYSDLIAPKGSDLGARATWNLSPDLAVAVWGKNLLNDRYAVTMSGGIGARIGIFNAPRTFGVEATYRFGD